MIGRRSNSTAWRSPDPKSGDRLEETLAAPQWHAKLIEVAVCETRQKLSIDFAVAKGGLILTETKAAEPSPTSTIVSDRRGINGLLIERACPAIDLE